ncbi:MAG TPA: hypothetical protein DEB39_09790 [Planctomycetaceae bacterium]|nr:hypothetical protein [Planctomycetaceae bacterium]
MLGTRLSTDMTRSRRGTLSLYGQAVWMHALLNRTYTDFTAQFSNPGMVNFSSNSKFTVRGNDPGRDWMVLGIGLNYDLAHWRLFGGYNAFTNDQQTLHTGNAGLAYGW